MPNDFLGLVPLMVLPKGWKLNWRASNKWGLTDTKPFVNTCQDSIWILDLNLDHLAIWRWKICAIFCRDIWRSIIEIKKEREREREIRKLIIKWGKTRVKEFNLQIRESRSLINVQKSIWEPILIRQIFAFSIQPKKVIWCVLTWLNIKEPMLICYHTTVIILLCRYHTSMICFG